MTPIVTRIRGWWQRNGLREHPIAYALAGLLTAVIGGGYATFYGGRLALLGVVCGAYGVLAALALLGAVADALIPGKE